MNPNIADRYNIDLFPTGPVLLDAAPASGAAAGTDQLAVQRREVAVGSRLDRGASNALAAQSRFIQS
jgi:hypothetical protein